MEYEKYFVCDLEKIFGVTRQTIHDWCRRGIIEYNEYPSGRKWFTREQIEAVERKKDFKKLRNTTTQNNIIVNDRGVFIPTDIWVDKNLKALDKFILATIGATTEENGCHSSNSDIANFCQCSENKVSKTISKLIKLGYLRVDGFDGRHRTLNITRG